MTYAGNSTRTSNRVLITLVVITITIVAYWAATGGLDEVQVTEQPTTVVSE